MSCITPKRYQQHLNPEKSAMLLPAILNIFQNCHSAFLFTFGFTLTFFFFGFKFVMSLVVELHSALIQLWLSELYPVTLPFLPNGCCCCEKCYHPSLCQRLFPTKQPAPLPTSFLIWCKRNIRASRHLNLSVSFQKKHR